ncbi:MAG: hypothetical protein RLZZ367_334 [Bacteroidota bacterium]|jgi:hypothetical protein
MSKKKLNTDQQKQLLSTLKARFEKNTTRHKGINWADVEARLKAKADKLWPLHEMEATSGEPDVVAFDKKTGAYTFMDCAAESPAGRRSLCYDEAALNARKENKPKGSAEGMAAEMGIELLTEEQYRGLQKLGKFDAKTSSWLKTPDAIRKLDGSLFGDYRYEQVFVYHNGAQSYYAARGFRGALVI